MFSSRFLVVLKGRNFVGEVGVALSQFSSRHFSVGGVYFPPEKIPLYIINLPLNTLELSNMLSKH